MKSLGECRILIERNHKQASVGGHHFHFHEQISISLLSTHLCIVFMCSPSASSSCAGLAALLMLLTWISLGCRHTGRVSLPVVWWLCGSGSVYRETRRVWSNLMSSVSRILCRYISVMLLTRPPSVHLLYHLLASQKLYFFLVYSQQQLNTISFQTLFFSLAFSDQRFTTRL